MKAADYNPDPMFPILYLSLLVKLDELEEQQLPVPQSLRTKLSALATKEQANVGPNKFRALMGHIAFMRQLQRNERAGFFAGQIQPSASTAAMPAAMVGDDDIKRKRGARA